MLKEYEEEEVRPNRVQVYFLLYESILLVQKAGPFYNTLALIKVFYKEDPATWESNQEFQSGKMRVKNIPVVNDIPEWGVALTEQFNSHHTTNENQLSYLLGVVEKDR